MGLRGTARGKGPRAAAPAAGGAPDDLLDRHGAARILRCNPRTVYKWAKHGCRVNGCVVVLGRVDVGVRSYFTPRGCAVVSGCALNSDGYAHLRCGAKVYGLHRLLYAALRGIAVSEIPGEVLRHGCDTPNCVSPNCLSPGSHADNVADRVRRGRSARGSRHGRAKLDEAKVALMRASAETDAHFARLYGVDVKAVSRARRGLTYRHVPMPAVSGDAAAA